MCATALRFVHYVVVHECGEVDEFYNDSKIDMSRIDPARGAAGKKGQKRAKTFAAVVIQMGNQINNAQAFAPQGPRQDTFDFFQVAGNRAKHVHWGREGFRFLPGFLAVTREHYGAELAQVDFIRSKVPDADVVLHPYSGEAGAIGAALCAASFRKGGAPSKFRGFDTIEALTYTLPLCRGLAQTPRTCSRRTGRRDRRSCTCSPTRCPP